MIITDKLEKYKKELHRMKYNLRIKMLFRLLLTAILGVEVIRED
jgi:hypothetical protein